MKFFFLFSLLFFLGISIQCTSFPSTTLHEDDDLYLNKADKKRIHTENHKIQKAKISQATVNPEISWTIKASAPQGTITIHGLPNQIDILANMLSDSFAVFPKDQYVNIEFRFNNTNASFKESIKVRDSKKFISDHFKLLSNCDKNDFSYPNWSFPMITKTETIADIDNNYAIQGKGCIMMKGVDSNKDGYIISLSKYFQNIYGNNSGTDMSLNSSADKTWIFFYLNGTGKPEDFFQLRFREGSSNYGQEYYKFDIPLDFKGWKQFAIKYSDIVSTDSDWKLLETQEKRIRDPKELLSIEYSLMTKSPGGQAITYIDQLMVVFDK